LIDGVSEPADVIIGDVGPPGFLGLLVFRPQFDDRIFSHCNYTARLGRHDDEAYFLETVGRKFDHAVHDLLPCADAARDTLLHGRRDYIPGSQRAAKECTLKRFARSLQSKVFLGRGEDDPLGRSRIYLVDFDIVAAGCADVHALQAVQSNDVKALVFIIAL
jgi:hypothetical protein